VVKFAVETLGQEHPSRAAGAVCRAGKTAHPWFRWVETLGQCTWAGRKFIRMRSDATTLAKIVPALLAAKRAVIILSETGGYQLHLGGRTAPVPAYVILDTSGERTMYLGPKKKGWEKQFP